MKPLTHVYTQALIKESKNATILASAYTLQQALYENSKIFGDLYKYDNFLNVFNTPPTTLEYITFISFWKGIDDVLSVENDILPEDLALELTKLCFVNDDYVNSMRIFRDELLKNTSYITRNELIESINTAKKESNLDDFWDRVLDNTKSTFTEDVISLSDISNMLYNFFYKRFNDDKNFNFEIDRASTCATLREGESHYVDRELKLKEDDDDNSYSFRVLEEEDDNNKFNLEYKYHKLLMELEQVLPKLYGDYSETKLKLLDSKEKLNKALKLNDKLSNDFTQEKNLLNDEINKIQREFKSIRSKNNELVESLEIKNVELLEVRQELNELRNRYNESDVGKLYDELQIFMAKCDGLQKANQNLKSIVDDLQLKLQTLSMRSNEDELKRNYEELELKFVGLQDEFTKLKMEDNLLKKNNEEYQFEFDKLKKDYNEVEEKYENVNDAYNRLSERHNDLNEEYLHLSEKYKDIFKKYEEISSKQQSVITKYENITSDDELLLKRGWKK